MVRIDTLLKYWLPFIAYCLLVVALSSIPGKDINLPSFALSDKIEHCAEYALVGALFARLWLNVRKNAETRSAFGAASAYSLIFGLTDELHQLFTPGRFCSAWDLLADLIGGTLGALIYVRWWKGKQ